MPASLSVLDSFDGADGTDPHDGLITDANGDLFGTASYGGPDAGGKIGGYGDGTVFEITYNAATGYAATPTLLASFNGTDGSGPYGGLIADANGDLFGTTIYGGANGGGTVFEITYNAATGYAGTPTVLANLNPGASPRDSLVADANGDLFGTTTYDGAYGGGTVFEIAKTAKTATGYAAATTLTSFSYAEGEVPIGNLIFDSSGDLFGTTDEDGANNHGTVFEIDKYPGGYASTPTVLASFDGTNGFGIMSGLIADASGDLFGTSDYAGADNGGAVYEIAKTATGYNSTPIVIASFPTTPLDGGANGYLPADPAADLIIDSQGDLFGTSMYGGTSDDGTVFEIVKTATGYTSTPVTLISLTQADGDLPASSLLSLASGGLLGTTEEGGADNAGTVFEVTLPPGPEIFSHVQAAASGSLTGYYLWSDAHNWTDGVPVNGDDAASAVAGLDDLPSLNLDALDLTGGGTVSATGTLTIQNLTETAGSEAFASTLLPGGTGTALVTAGTLSGSGGDYGAFGANAIFEDESATSPGDALYLAGSGGKLIVANALAIGGDSAGVLDITNGGKATSASGNVGTGAGTGIVTVAGAESSWTIAGALTIGVLNAGNAPSVTISNQASVISSASFTAEDHLIGGSLNLQTAGSLTEIELEISPSATLNVDSGGILSEYAASPNLSYIGLLGNGQMNFDGGTLASANEQTDIGEVAYHVAGNGTLTASNGAYASNLATDIGIDKGDTGTLVLTGAATGWTDTYNAPVDDNNAGLVVGQSGNGTLLIGDGATLTNPLSYIKIGQYAGAAGYAQVTGSGSTLSAGGLLRIADSGQGTLAVDSGGAVSAGQVQLGDFAGSNGDLMIGAGGDLTTDAASSIDTGPQNGADVAAGSFDIGVHSGAQGSADVNGGALGVDGNLTVGDAGTGSLSVENAGVVSAANVDVGTGAGTGSIILGPEGTVTASAVQIGANGSILMEGGLFDPPNQVTIDLGGAVQGFGLIDGDVINNGSITAADGTLTLSGSESGAGSLFIDAGEELIVQGSVGSGQSVSFNGAGTLTLGDAPGFAGTISGFGPGDVIDFSHLSIASATTLSLNAEGVLSGSIGGETLNIHFDGAPAGTQFVVTPDGSGGAEAICYLRGTRILTPSGEVNVENLQIGDTVITRWFGCRPIKWIGRQAFAWRFLRNDRARMPVCIKAGALGGDLPLRDLYVSPGHSMLLEGVLVLARSLVNGITITQDVAEQDIFYYQIEFETHDCVLAEGAWSESYADAAGMRNQFHNAAEFCEMFPAYIAPAAPLLCAVRPLHGAQLDAALRPCVARAELAAGASTAPGPLRGYIDRITADGRIEGWAQDQHYPELPVLLKVLLDDHAVQTVLACDYRGDLAEACIGQGRSSFSLTLADGIAPSAMAKIKVQRAADGANLPFSHACQASGHSFARAG